MSWRVCERLGFGGCPAHPHSQGGPNTGEPEHGVPRDAVTRSVALGRTSGLGSKATNTAMFLAFLPRWDR